MCSAVPVALECNGKLAPHFPQELSMSSAPDVQPPAGPSFPGFRKTQTAWWVVLFFLLYGVLSAAQLLIWILALGSLAMLLLSKGEWARLPGIKIYWGMLACLLIPGVLSLIDAINLDRALSTNARLLAYGLTGYFFVRAAPSAQQWPSTVLWLSGVLVFWSVDGLVQEWRGVSLTGYPVFTGIPEGHKVTGSLGLDYGPTLAVLSPFLFEALRLHGRRLPGLWLAVPVLAIAVSLSASRYSALLLLVGAALYGLICMTRGPFRGWRTTALLVGGCLAGLLVPVWVVPHLFERLQLLWVGLGSNPDQLNAALAYRPELWQASWQVFADNWVTGVGIRGSSEAIQPILAASPHFPHAMLSQPWHPHLGVLEIATDTGVIGVMGYCLLFFIIVRIVLRGRYHSDCGAPVFLTVAALALFPFSSALSIYSFPTGSIAWPALAFALGGLVSGADENSGAVASP